jgi:hypothetical protein
MCWNWSGGFFAWSYSMVYRVGQVRALTRRRQSSGNPQKIQRSPIETSQWLAINYSDKQFLDKFFLVIDPMIADRNKCGRGTGA